ncbi:MAG: hypothetical protein ACOCXH_13165 [Cyclobacteriaceae bacterium]
MVATQYYMRQMLPLGQYYRLNPYYKGEDAPEALKNQDLKIDMTDKQQLTAINQYANKIYQEKKQEILEFLEISNKVVIP